MKFVLAPDSFKGSLSALQVCQAMERGIAGVFPDATVEKLPMADGGEGTVDALISSTGGRREKAKVAGPLGHPVQAEFGILGDGRTAVIEMAAASGLPLVPVSSRNPLKTTTFGTGQLMRVAIEKGCRKLIIGIGGSATTDCGTGMAQALGVRFYDRHGREIPDYMCGELMGKVGSIDVTQMHPLLKETKVTVACDVDNPLLGEHGAVMVYSRQKGATEAQLQILEENMGRIIDVIEQTIGRRLRDVPGAGAAGGLGAGLMAFVDAELKPGVQLVMEACQFDKRIAGASLILTGEGKADAQTIYGKTISGVATAAKKQNIPVIVLAGSVSGEAKNLYEIGVTAMFSICPGPITLQQAKNRARQLIENTTEQVMRIYRLKQ